MTTIINPRRINRTIVVERDSRTLTARVIDALDAPNGIADMLADAEAARDDAQQAVTDAQGVKDGLLDDLTVTANTLAPGEPATADWDGDTQLLTLGIPEGQPGDVSGMVRFDAAQTLTAPQQAQARTNIGAADSATAVVNTRTITAGTGLTGGGDLTADRTLAADFATEAEALAGTATDKVMSPARVRAADSARRFGAGQSPVDVTSSRVAGTWYQNTTGREIGVIWTGNNGQVLQLSPDMSTIIPLNPSAASFAQFLVPAGWRYRLQGGALVSIWEIL